MKLKVIGSGSKGNAYLLESDHEALLIECGVHISRIKQAVRFDISKIVGCIVTHEHQDHSRAYKEVIQAGIDLYATQGTIDAFGMPSHRFKVITYRKAFEVGGFKVLPCEVKHDANEPCGFFIQHPAAGHILFLTDTQYSPYTFKGLNHAIIEANYSQKVIDERVAAGVMPQFLRDRIIKSHTSLDTCLGILKANDLRALRNVVLIHLSDENFDEQHFLSEVQKLTSAHVALAKPGVEVDFNLEPF